MTDQMNRMTSCNKMMESMMNSGSSGYPVCTENLNPDVVVMKSAKDRV